MFIVVSTDQSLQYAYTIGKTTGMPHVATS